MTVAPGTKVQKIADLYASLLESHFDALNDGYVRSLQGQYGAEDFFRHVAEAGTRMGELWQAPWYYVFPRSKARALRIPQGCKAGHIEALDIAHPGTVTLRGGLEFTRTGDNPIKCTATFAGSRRPMLLLQFDEGIEAAPKTGDLPFTASIQSTESENSIVDVALYIE
jgi:hypothetical protein